jgi:hypothetical protein
MSVKSDETAKRLMAVPGVGPVIASAIMATILDIGDGGRPRLGRITKMGDGCLRKLLVVGACATLRHRKGHSGVVTPTKFDRVKILEVSVRFRPRWRLATSGTLRLGGRGACGGM